MSCSMLLKKWVQLGYLNISGRLRWRNQAAKLRQAAPRRPTARLHRYRYIISGKPPFLCWEFAWIDVFLK